MRSVVAVLILLAWWPLHAAIGPGTTQNPAGDPDRLYGDRQQLSSALEAASIWEARLKQNPQDFDSAWKLARASYWLGGHAPSETRRQHFERGIEAGTRASTLQPRRPEGHFWTAANMGSMAESFGLRAGIKYRGPVKRELEAVLALDPAFMEGSADRALGRWYFRVPGLFGGSDKKAVEHLLKSITYDPGSAASYFFLAETYEEMGDVAKTRDALQRVLDAPVPRDWEPETREFKDKARAMLAKSSR